MNSVPVPRWAISFADLILLLLGCFVLLHAMEAARGSRPSAAGGAVSDGLRAADLFQPGEALLTASARATLQARGRGLTDHKVRIVSQGAAESGSRLDRFELSAARAAAVGRALREGGLGEGDLTIAVADTEAAASQTITILPR